MKIGVRAHDYGRHRAKEYAEMLKAEGYETVQLAIPKAIEGVGGYEDITERLLSEIRQAFSDAGIEIAVLGCYMDLGNPDQKIRQYAVHTFKKSLYHAKLLGAGLVGTETSCAHLSKMEKAEWFPYMLDSLKRLAEEAERLDMKMGIEPVAFHPLESAETAAEVLRELGSSRVKVILDPANLLERPGEIFQEAYWKRCLATLGPMTEAVHLKDFIIDEAGNYQAKMLGEGVMDYRILESWLQSRPDMPVLREEMVPATAGKDLEYLRAMKKRMEKK